MTSEQRAEITMVRKRLTELEFALMDGEDGAIAAGLHIAAIQASMERVINSVEGTPPLEHAAQNARYY